MGPVDALPPELVPAGFQVSATQLNAYAALTRDTNPIHLDHRFAASTPFGKCIAHGTLSLNALWQSIEQTLGPVHTDRAPALTLDIRFTAPVYVDEQLLGGGSLRQDRANVYDVWVKAGGRTVIAGELIVE